MNFSHVQTHSHSSAKPQAAVFLLWVLPYGICRNYGEF